MNLRRLRLGLLTVTGLARRGFFIPYRYADTIVDHQPEYAEIAASFSRHEPTFARTLELIDEVAESLTAFSGPPPAPRWAQDWFPRSDGAAAYAMVRHHKPGRIVEVGSGHSTRFMLQAVAETSKWTTGKIAAIRALAEHTTEHVRTRLPKIYTRELVDVIFEQPYCRIGNLVDKEIAQRQAASRYLHDLAALGVLREMPFGKEKLFIHPKLMLLLTRDSNDFPFYA